MTTGVQIRLTTRQIAMWSLIAALLLAPLIAMQFTREVAWTGFDFAVAAGLLGGGGALFELAASRTRDRRLRWAIGATILTAMLVIWAEGAVGIF